MNRRKSPTIFIVILFLFLITINLGCGSGYKTFKQLKGYDHYSFEYPAGYKLTMTHAYSNSLAVNGVRFTLNHWHGTNSMVLGVNIENYSDEYPNLKTRVDRTLSVEGRKLLEQSTVSVAGVQYEILTYNTENSNYMKTALFDYNDRAWDFYVYSEQENADQVDIDFEHLFTTFKLLP